MDLYKNIAICQKTKLNNLLRVIDLSVKVMVFFCTLFDNRNYMLTTNRILPLIDLLSWCLIKPAQYVYSLEFVPSLLQLISSHIKHRVKPENLAQRDQIVEYIFCSGFLNKIKQKFMSFQSGLDLSTAMGKVPLALLKSISFLETLTSYSSFE